MSCRFFKLKLLIGTCFFISNASLANANDQIQLPYYARTLNGPAYEILCLNTREAKNPLIVGHSSLTSFRIDQSKSSKSSKNSYLTDEAISTGFWPYNQKSDIDSEHKAKNLHINNPDDYFLTFNKNAENRNGDRLCVPITKSEKDSLNSFFSKNKNKKWNVLYNCNDISSKAFEVATGIKFNSRSPVTAYLSHPANMVIQVKKYLKIRVPAGSFTYAPKSDSEKKVLSENIKAQADMEAAQEKAANTPRALLRKIRTHGNR